MTKLIGQAYDTEKLYTQLKIDGLREYVERTGLIKDGISLDTSLFLKFISDSGFPKPKVLEVGCGYGRIGKVFLENAVDYFGIDLHKEYVDYFRENLSNENNKKILHGNFLTYNFPFNKIDFVLFPWSVIAEFDFNGQINVFNRVTEIALPNSRIYFDIPLDIINKPDGIEPGPLNIDEIHNWKEMGLIHIMDHSYQTYTGRNRKIIELGLKNN